MDHGWVSFVFQGSRSLQRSLSSQATEEHLGTSGLVSSLDLAAAHLVALQGLPLCLAELNVDSVHQRRWFLICLALGPIVLFTAITFWGAQGLFHWQAPGYLFLFPLLGDAIVRKNRLLRRTVQRWLATSAAVFLLLLAILGTQTATGWMKTTFPHMFTAGDPTLEALDWRGITPQLAADGLLKPPVQFIVAGHWIDAGKVDYALGGRLPVLCLSNEPHHFAFIHHPADFKGQDALIIGRRDVIHDAAAYLPYFDSITYQGVVPS